MTAAVRSAAAAVLAYSIVVSSGCSAGESARPIVADHTSATLEPPTGRGLQPVILPEFDSMQEAVRTQMQARRAALVAALQRDPPSDTELATAYGEMGKLLMAATEFDPAERCYINAQTLAPLDHRWPYYLGHLYRAKGPLEKSAAAFERALELQRDLPTLVWLGEAYLAQGHAERAEPLFADALRREPDSAAARFGAGRAALARRDFKRAAELLEQALARDPRATSIRYPLAMAYRGLGDTAKARAHLAEQGDVETRPHDPLMREVDVLLESPEAYNVRGGQALEARDWNAAAESFRQGLQLAPNDPSLRHRLGTALAQMGDVQGAMEQFQRVLRTSPTHARSHFSLGVLLRGQGRHQEAIDHFAAALAHEPGYVPARVQLAAALARSGRPGDAVSEYERAIDADPTSHDAAFGHALALVRLGRYRGAVDRLHQAIKLFPDQPMFANALARLLAAAPDDRVRDGARAKAIVDALLEEGQQNFELAETTAMMLAELGQYAAAAAVQRDVVAAARQMGRRLLIDRAEANLRLYEGGRPCRTPFTEEELP